VIIIITCWIELEQEQLSPDRLPRVLSSAYLQP